MVIKYFEKWLKTNGHRFNHKVIIVKKEISILILKYENIIPQIRPVILKNGDINVEVEYNKISWDFLLSLDSAAPARTASGEYYCKDCIDKKIYYDTLEELYCQHQFEAFLEWSNENISNENFLHLHGKKEHFTGARILSPEKLKEWNKTLEYVFAILKLEKF